MKKINIKRVLLGWLVAIFIGYLLYFNAGLRHESDNILAVEAENRRITQIPEGSMTKKEFYNQFEQWYSDRLINRRSMVERWTKMNYHKLGVLPRDDLAIGDNDWIFCNDYIIRNLDGIEKKINKIKEIQEYCKRRGVKFITTVPPSKECMYYYELPEYWRRVGLDPMAVYERVNKLFKEKDIHYIDLYWPMENALKNDKLELYFKDDHHWDYNGAAIWADLLLKDIDEQLNTSIYSGFEFDGTTVKAYKDAFYWNRVGISASNETTALWSSKFTDEIYIKDCRTGVEQKVSNGGDMCNYFSRPLHRQPDMPVSQDVMWDAIVSGEAIVLNKAIDNNIIVVSMGDSYSNYAAAYTSQKIHKWVATHFMDHIGEKNNTDLARLIDVYHPNVVILEIAGLHFFTIDDCLDYIVY